MEMDIETIDNELCMEMDSDENEGDDLGGAEGNDLGGDEGDDLGVGEGDNLAADDSITPKVGMEFLTQDEAYKFYNRYALKMGFGTRWSSIAPPLSQNSSNLLPEINIRDPTVAARHKGRPRLPSRMQSAIGQSQEEANKKRRTCEYCGEKGHYRTGCSKAKDNNVACSGQSIPGGSQTLPRIDA